MGCVGRRQGGYETQGKVAVGHSPPASNQARYFARGGPFLQQMHSTPCSPWA